MKSMSIAVVSCAMVSTICTVLSTPIQANEPGFKDDFQTLDRSRWYVSSGWTNGDHQNCLWHEDQVETSNETDRLLLSLSDVPRGDHEYSCGEIQSDSSFGYGIYEASLRTSFASGVNSNFFAHIGAPQDLPHNEIDFEFIVQPGEGPVIQSNYSTNDEGGNEVLHPVDDEGREFHVYAFEWTPDHLRWYINGALIREEAEADIPEPPQKIYFSIWSTGTLIDWMGPLEYPDTPLVLEVDYVAFQPLNSGCAFIDSIPCSQ